MQAVLFDMDGVLIDSEHTYNAIEMAICRSLGLDITEEMRLAFVGAPMQEAWTKVVNTYHLDIQVDDLVEEEKRRYRQALDNGDIPVIQGMADLLKRLHADGYKTAIVSSAQRDIIELTVEQNAFNRYIDFSISGQDVKNGKPDPEPFLMAAEKMGVKPEQCAVIEDSKNGALAAKSAGMVCVGYQPDNGLPQDLSVADVIIHDADGLEVAFIEGLFRTNPYLNT